MFEDDGKNLGKRKAGMHWIQPRVGLDEDTFLWDDSGAAFWFF